MWLVTEVISAAPDQCNVWGGRRGRWVVHGLTAIHPTYKPPSQFSPWCGMSRRTKEKLNYDLCAWQQMIAEDNFVSTREGELVNLVHGASLHTQCSFFDPCDNQERSCNHSWISADASDLKEWSQSTSVVAHRGSQMLLCLRLNANLCWGTSLEPPKHLSGQASKGQANWSENK
jgi:hypothetical protein